MASHDLEDLITVVAGRPSIVEEMADTPNEVRDWMAEQLADFLAGADAEYAVQGALPDAVRIPELIPTVLERLRRLAASE